MNEVNLRRECKYYVVNSSMNNFSLFLYHNGISGQRVCFECCEIKKRVKLWEGRGKITIFSMKGDNAVISKVI